MSNDVMVIYAFTFALYGGTDLMVIIAHESSTRDIIVVILGNYNYKDHV